MTPTTTPTTTPSTSPQARGAPTRGRHLLTQRWASAALALVLTLVVLVTGPQTPMVDRDVVTGDAELAAQVRGVLGSGAGHLPLHVSVITADSVTHAGVGQGVTGQAPTADTHMELGSITKTFNGQLLADAVNRGEVRAEDPASAHLPELEGTDAGRTTLEELATHTSGLPEDNIVYTSLWSTARTLLGLNAWEATTEQLLTWAGQTPATETRGSFLYSNVGADVLGHALARAAGYSSWQDYVTDRLLAPTGMTRTVFADTSADTPVGTLPGTWPNGHRVQAGASQGSAPSGSSTRTTPADMATYAQAVLNDTVPGGRAAQEPRVPTDTTTERIGYHWFLTNEDGHTILNHSGGTFGYSTNMVIDKEAGRAVIVFSPTSNNDEVTTVSSALLSGRVEPTQQAGASALTPVSVISLAAAGVTLLAGVGIAVAARWTPSRLSVVARWLDAVGWTALAATLGPWHLVPGWILAVVALPGLYGAGRATSRWGALPWVPQTRGRGRALRRIWAGGRLLLALAFAAACVAAAWPKG